MRRTKWLDRTQPQTLYMATLLMYINAGLSLLFGLAAGTRILGVAHLWLIVSLLLIVGQIVGGWGIANEKNFGYIVAVVVAFVLLALTIFGGGASIITLIFEIALVALLLHPQSRAYRKIWFR
ncbi:MAG TPA: hypothetical protein VKV06_00665 [Acidimicrobiales bacterium]|nr:hypothetical protein [Acidimicrobiales bacterium]